GAGRASGPAGTPQPAPKSGTSPESFPDWGVAGAGGPRPNFSGPCKTFHFLSSARARSAGGGGAPPAPPPPPHPPPSPPPRPSRATNQPAPRALPRQGGRRHEAGEKPGEGSGKNPLATLAGPLDSRTHHRSPAFLHPEVCP